MNGNMSYTISMSFEDIDTIKALKRYNGMNAKTLIHDALTAYMEKKGIEISIDEDTVWVWSMIRPDAGFMTRADEKWHDAISFISRADEISEWEDDFTLKSEQYF